MKKLLFIAASAILLSNTASAANLEKIASVTNVQGNAVVTRGVANVPLKVNMVLVEGDKVVVLDKSSISLKYIASQCKANYTPNTIIAISKTAQCIKGSNFGVGAPQAEAVSGAASGGMITAGAAVAAGLGLAFASANQSNTPVSAE